MEAPAEGRKIEGRKVGVERSRERWGGRSSDGIVWRG